MIKIIPKRDILDCKQTNWECELYKKGWNELKQKDKFGKIIGEFEIEGKYKVLDISFPKLDIVVKNVFWDEIKGKKL